MRFKRTKKGKESFWRDLLQYSNRTKGRARNSRSRSVRAKERIHGRAPAEVDGREEQEKRQKIQKTG